MEVGAGGVGRREGGVVGGGESWTYVGNRHFGAGTLTKILHHVDDEHRALGDLALWGRWVSCAARDKVVGGGLDSLTTMGTPSLDTRVMVLGP